MDDGKNLPFKSGSKTSFDEFVSTNRLESLLQPSTGKRKAGQECNDSVVKKAASIGNLVTSGGTFDKTNEAIVTSSNALTNEGKTFSMPSMVSDAPPGEDTEPVLMDEISDGLPEFVPPQGGQTGESSKRTSILYSDNHFGDYLVLCDTSGLKGKKDNLRNSLFFFESIRGLRFKGILLISHIGKTLFRVKFESAKDANEFVSFDFSELGYRAFIPNTFIYSYGVIRGIPFWYTDDYMKENIISSVPIISVERFHAKDPEVEGESVPMFSVKVGFNSNEIPTSIVLDYSVVKVSVFYPPLRQCRKCGRLGHTERGCHSRKRCLKCGKMDDCDGSCVGTGCILCGSDDHISTDKSKCSKWNREFDILKIMTLKRLSRREVLGSFPLNGYDVFKEYDENFPPMGNGRNPLPVVGEVLNREEEVNRIVTRRKFNRVVKPRPPPRLNKPIPQVQPVDTNPSIPVIYRKMDKVSQFERLISEMTGVMKAYFSERRESSYVRVLDDFEVKFNSALNEINQELSAVDCSSSVLDDI